MTKKITLFILATLALSSCQNGNRKKPVFHYSKFLEMDIDGSLSLTSDRQAVKMEYIIIQYSEGYTNEELKVFIHDYEKKFRTDTVEIASRYDRFYRFYYRESRKTPIDFIDDPGGFSTDIINDHVEDYVCSKTMTKRRLPDDTVTFEWIDECRITK
jgi:hypothetical protein